MYTLRFFLKSKFCSRQLYSFRFQGFQQQNLVVLMQNASNVLVCSIDIDLDILPASLFHEVKMCVLEVLLKKTLQLQRGLWSKNYDQHF
jgi:hypothetical protein